MPTMAIDVKATPQPSDYPSWTKAYSVIGMLMIVTFMSLIDRQIPNFLVGPIRETLRISDTEMSLIQGLSFAIIFSLAGMPMGAMVDRFSRRNIIVAGCGIWSVATIACGFASTFEQLFIARVVVGIGEAALAPAVYSLIADYVEPGKRGKAISIYFLSNNLGSGLALIAIGWLVTLGPAIANSASLLAGFSPWQVAFMLAGIPGLIMLPALMTISEVPRRSNIGAIHAEQKASGLREFFAYLRGHAKVFVCIIVPLSCLQFCVMASYAWAPTFFIRKFGLPAETVGLVLGLTIGGFAFCGGITSALTSDRLAARSRGGGRMLIPALALGGIAPLHLAWPLVGDWRLSVLLFGLTCFAASTAYASAPSIVQDVVTNRMRGKATALYMMVAGLVGYGFGPTAVALLTDHVFHDDQALPYSLALCLAPVATVGCLIALLGLRDYVRLREALHSGAA